MKRWLLVCAALASCFAVAKDCSFETFRPQFLTERALYDFTMAGLGQVMSRSTDEKGVEIVRTTLVRDLGAVGIVEFQSDARQLTKHFVLRDIRGRSLLSVIEERKGVSRTEIEIYSELQTPSDMPFLTILFFPVGGTYHYVGVKDEGITTFYSIFKKAWKEAVEAIVKESSPALYFIKSPRERFLFRAQSNPLLTPYMSLISVAEFGKTYRVTGVLPSNGLYSVLLDLAHEELGFATRFDVNIDERLQLPMPVKPVCKN